MLLKNGDDGQPPLLLLRSGFNQSRRLGSLQGQDPYWWKTQVFSRPFQITHGNIYTGNTVSFSLAHQRFHGGHHYLFFNRRQILPNPLDDFLVPPKSQIAVSHKFLSACYFIDMLKLLSKAGVMLYIQQNN